MSNTWKIYMLAIVSFLVGTSEYIISGILDHIAHTLGITLPPRASSLRSFHLYMLF